MHLHQCQLHQHVHLLACRTHKVLGSSVVSLVGPVMQIETDCTEFLVCVCVCVCVRQRLLAKRI